MGRIKDPELMNLMLEEMENIGYISSLVISVGGLVRIMLI